MTEIILTPAQTQQFSQATDGVVFCDAVGNVIVRVPPQNFRRGSRNHRRG